MIEAAIYVALGFLAATLIGLMILPAISRRADRLARRRAAAAFPLSLEEVAADRDHLRAELALRARGHERETAAARAERAEALTKLGWRDTEIASHLETLRQRESWIADLESALAAMTADRDDTAARLARESEAHAATAAELERTLAEVARLEAVLHERNEQIGELTRARELLMQELAGLRSELSAANAHGDELQSGLAKMTALRDEFAASLAAEQAALAALREEKAELDRAFMARGQDLDAERRRAAHHADERDAARLDLQEAEGRLAERERERLALETRFQRLESDAARERTTFGDRLRQSSERLEAAIAARQTAESGLVQLREERAGLKQQATVAKRELARIEAGVQAENAALRAEIVKLAGAIAEKLGGPPRVTPPPPANAETPAVAPAARGKTPAKSRRAAAS